MARRFAGETETPLGGWGVGQRYVERDPAARSGTTSRLPFDRNVAECLNDERVEGSARWFVDPPRSAEPDSLPAGIIGGQRPPGRGAGRVKTRTAPPAGHQADAANWLPVGI